MNLLMTIFVRTKSADILINHLSLLCRRADDDFHSDIDF